MENDLVTFNGNFQLWLYIVGRGRLLLRSTKSPERATQIDILFKNVAAIQLPVSFDNLKIAKLPPGQESPIALGRREWANRSLYHLQGTNWDGYIVAGALAWDEADREYHEPSPLME